MSQAGAHDLPPIPASAKIDLRQPEWQPLEAIIGKHRDNSLSIEVPSSMPGRKVRCFHSPDQPDRFLFAIIPENQESMNQVFDVEAPGNIAIVVSRKTLKTKDSTEEGAVAMQDFQDRTGQSLPNEQEISDLRVATYDVWEGIDNGSAILVIGQDVE